MLATNNVTTLAGSSLGYRNGIGSDAQFIYTWGIVFHSSGVLYITENYYSGGYYSNIRKIVVAVANVTTVVPSVGYYYSYNLCVNTLGTVLYVSTSYIILQVDASSGMKIPLAGSYGVEGSRDGVGTAALFNGATGIALNSNESALIIADVNGLRIRMLEIASRNVTTIAGSSAGGSRDGPGLTATFSFPYGVKWYCNVSLASCGVLVADTNNNAMRFVSVESMPTATNALSVEATATLSNSLADSFSFSSTWTLSPSRRISATISKSVHVSTSHSWTLYASSSVSRTKIGSSSITNASTFSLSVTCIHTHSLSPSATNATSNTASPSNASLVPTSSPSRSNSQAAKSASITRRTPSPSATTYCALVPADGELAVGRLQVFNESSATSGAIPLRPSLLGTSPGAARVSRAVLLRNTPFGANLSLALGGTIRGGPVDGWRIVNVAMDVVPVNSLLPLLTAVVPFTLMSDAVVGRTQSLAVMIDPSNATTPPRWLPASLSTFRDVTMVLQLSLRCPTDDSITAIVTVQVPCPGEVQPLASEVKAAGGVAQYSASLAGPAGGGAVARVAAVRSLVQCSGDSVVEGLLPLVVDACGDDWARGSSAASGARGGILGNFVLWVAACMLMALAFVVYAHLGRTTLLLAAEALGVPSPLLPLIVVTLPSTVSSTFYLIHSPSCGSDNVVAAFGVLMLVSPMGVLCILACAVPSQLAVVIHEQASSPNTARSCRLVVAHILSLLVRRRVRWRELHVDTRDATTSSGGQVAPTQSGRQAIWAHTLLRAATVLLLDYASVWYACVDIAVLTASCVLGAMGMLGSASACRGGAIAILVLFSVQLALCAAVRPFTSLFSHVAALFMLVLSVIAVACQVWYLFGSAAENADLNALSKLLTAAAACDLLVSGASLLKSLLDIVDTLKACHRHLSVLCATQKLPLIQIMENTQKLLISGDVELLCEDVVLPTKTALDDDDILMTLVVEKPFEDGGGIFTASERMRATNDNDLIRGLELVEEHLSNIFDDEGDEHT